MLGEEFFHIFHARIHLAFHIAGRLISAVIENSLIMNQTVWI